MKAQGIEASNPLRAALEFWKLLGVSDELERLASYRTPGELSSNSVAVWCGTMDAGAFKVRIGDVEFSLFASVHPIAQPIEAAQVLAEIITSDGGHHSYVLWFPDTRCVVVPFDPEEAIEALRFERYIPPAEKTVLPARMLRAYYAVRSLVPPWLRIRLRRALVGDALEERAFLKWPSDDSLDELMRLLLKIVLMVLDRPSVPFVWFWPDHHPWAVILTHDVETAHGLENVRRIAELEQSRGLRSSFNMVVRDYGVPGELFAWLRESGFEIGVHGLTHDGLMFSSWSTFSERAALVNECGRRWGAQGFRSPATYRNLDWFHLLDFDYDSSVADTAPFEPQPGGCGSVFPYLVGDMVELPMTLPQDHTLFGLLGHGDSRLWTAKLERISACNGMACMLTHPDPGAGYMGDAENERRYTEVLDLIAGSEAWKPLPHELASWWRERADSGSAAPDLSDRAGIANAMLAESGALRIIPPKRRGAASGATAG